MPGPKPRFTKQITTSVWLPVTEVIQRRAWGQGMSAAALSRVYMTPYAERIAECQDSGKPLDLPSLEAANIVFGAIVLGHADYNRQVIQVSPDMEQLYRSGRDQINQQEFNDCMSISRLICLALTERAAVVEMGSRMGTSH